MRTVWMKSCFCRSAAPATKQWPTTCHSRLLFYVKLKSTDVFYAFIWTKYLFVYWVVATQSFISMAIASSASAHLHLMLVIVWCVQGCVGVGDILDSVSLNLFFKCIIYRQRIIQPWILHLYYTHQSDTDQLRTSGLYLSFCLYSVTNRLILYSACSFSASIGAQMKWGTDLKSCERAELKSVEI